MKKIDSILVATDFSADARHAAERAALIATDTGAKNCTVLHVLETSWLDSLKHLMNVPVETEQKFIDEAKHSLDKWTDRIQHHTRVALQHRIEIGHPADKILEVAASFDLLVLGARGTHRVREFAVGTMAQRILRKTTRPVLITRHKPASAYQRVMVAVDFSDHARRALAAAPLIAPGAEEVCLVNVFEVPFEGKMFYAGAEESIIHEYRLRAKREAEIEMRHFIETSGVNSKNLLTFIEHGYAPHRLHEKSRELDSDLIVVGKHGKSITEELLLGSITQHLLAESHCDVLVV